MVMHPDRGVEVPVPQCRLRPGGWWAASVVGSVEAGPCVMNLNYFIAIICNLRC